MRWPVPRDVKTMESAFFSLCGEFKDFTPSHASGQAVARLAYAIYVLGNPTRLDCVIGDLNDLKVDAR